MNIQAIRAYSDPIVRETNGQNVIQRQEQRKVDQTNAQSAQQRNSNSQLLTKQEREFFIKMFPENSTQIEKHILFNRNGRIQSQSFSKGLLVDAKV